MVTRIRQLLDWQQLSPTQFADLIGVGRPVVSHILSERNKPSLEVVQRIIAAFPAVSLPWLLSGSGAMLDAPEAGKSVSTPATTPTTAAVGPTTHEEEAGQFQLPAPILPAPAVAAAPTSSETARVLPIASPSIVPAASPPPSAAYSSPKNPPVSPVAPASTVGPAPARFVASRPRAAAATPPSALAAAAITGAPVGLAPQPELPVTKYPVATPAAPAVSPSAVFPIASSSVIVPADLPSVAAPAASLPQPAASEATALLPFLGEPGKAIRRIVIFYRDGSFADYQPEA